jgi:hypothetical protein
MDKRYFIGIASVLIGALWIGLDITSHVILFLFFGIVPASPHSIPPSIMLLCMTTLMWFALISTAFKYLPHTARPSYDEGPKALPDTSTPKPALRLRPYRSA